MEDRIQNIPSQRGKITQKNKAWGENCKRIDTYLGGRKSTERWNMFKSMTGKT